MIKFVATMALLMSTSVMASELATTEQKINFGKTEISKALAVKGLTLLSDSVSVYTSTSPVIGIVGATDLVASLSSLHQANVVEFEYFKFTAKGDGDLRYSGWIYVVSVDKNICAGPRDPICGHGEKFVNPSNGREVILSLMPLSSQNGVPDLNLKVD